MIIDRFATNRSVTKGRSYCEHCKKTLEVQDLIPVLSFLYLRGKCRYCGKEIPKRLILVELIGGITLLYLFFSYSLVSPILFILVTLIVFTFIAIFFIDLQYGIIPDKLTIFLTLTTLLYVMVSGQSFLNHIVAGLGSLLFFLFLFIITKGRGMGFGDVKISFALGLLLGYPLIILGLYLAFLTGALVSIILVIWKKKKMKGGTVPFGPFLVFGALFTLFFGSTLLLPLIRILF